MQASRSWSWVVVLAVLAGCSDENQPPVAAASRTVAMDEDSVLSLDVLEGASDPDGDALIVIGASATGAHRVDVFAGATVTVTPAKDFHGAIDVTYRLSDAAHIVNGHVLVTVRPVNDAPTAAGGTQQVHAPAVVMLAGSDVDGDVLTYEVVTGPSHGVLTGTPPALRYAPTAGFVGEDAIEYRVRDAATSSEPATMHLQVGPGASPRALDESFLAAEDTVTRIVLRGVDPDDNPLSFAVVEPPAHGTLAGDPPNVVYTPAADFTGGDSFTFAVSNGYASSDAARVSVFMNPVNDAPVALAQTIGGSEDGSIAITLGASDPDNTALAFVAQAPAHGTLSGFGSARTYRPEANFNGRDSFTFTASDGQLSSASATVTIDVAAVDDPPIAAAVAVAATEDVPATVMLRGSDADGDPVTVAIATQPAHGVLDGTPPALTYTPAANFSGTDTFTYTASSGEATSAPATVTIQVAAVNDPPVASDSAVATAEDTPVAIQLQASDVDSSLSFSITQLPSDGTLTGAGANRTYTPAANAHGTRTLRFDAFDGSRTASATVTIEIASVNDAPVAEDNAVFTEVDAPITVDVLGNDVDADGDALVLDAVGDPAHGTAAIVDGRLAYTPDAGFVGVDVMTYAISDGQGGTDTALATVGVGAFPPGMPSEVPVTMGGTVNTGTPQRAPAISNDGRIVAFSSPLELTTGDSNGALDVFTYDRVSHAIARVSVATGGGQGNGPSVRPHLSGDGRYVVFESTASNLVAGDSNGASDVFRHDRTTGETVRISVATGGAQASGASIDAEISDDGNVVAFSSSAFDLVADDANGAGDVFVRDVAAATTTRVSVPAAGGEGDVAATEPTLSADGRFVAFSSAATNLVAGDTNNASDVFVRDRVAGTLVRISVSSTGGQADRACRGPSISRDGRFISFLSDATNLLPGTTSGIRVYTRDAQATTTTRAELSGSVLHARLSGDGHYLAVYTGGGTTVFDRFAGTTLTPTFFNLAWPAVSGNGRYMAVISLDAPIKLRIDRIPP